MLKKLLTVSIALVVAGFASMTVRAQSTQDEIASEVDAVLKNIVALAEVFPADQYEWAPTEAVFPFRRHVVHVAQASYFILRFGGVEAPEGVDVQGALENLTEKEDVVAFLKETHELAVASIREMSDETMNSMVEMYGSERTVRAALLTYLRHNSEHLGQLISYARMQDIVPPWSE